jgi:hypothetical protein
MATQEDGFRGRDGYAGYDHGTCGGGPCREFFLYSAASGRLVCVTCNPLSRVATADAQTDVLAGGAGSPPLQHLSHALSDDGSRVFFSTPEALVAQDSNGKWDAYEYDVATATLHLISTGKDPADSYFMDASPDGRDVFFTTRERLVGWDIDQNYDLYDARVDGGFPEPVAPPVPCAGETCRAPAALPPGFSGAPASATFSGAPNATPTVLRPLTRAQKLAKAQKLSRALKACRKTRPRAHRKKCESQARRQFGNKASRSKPSRWSTSTRRQAARH